MSRHDGGFRRKGTPPAPRGRRDQPHRSHGSAEYEEQLRKRHEQDKRDDIGQRASDSETEEEQPDSEYWVG